MVIIVIVEGYILRPTSSGVGHNSRTRTRLVGHEEREVARWGHEVRRGALGSVGRGGRVDVEQELGHLGRGVGDGDGERCDRDDGNCDGTSDGSAEGMAEGTEEGRLEGFDDG